MKIHKFLSIAIAFFTGLLLVLASCIQQPETPLRIGFNVWPGYEPMFLAKDLNYYQKAAIELIDYPSASALIQAYRNGEIQGGGLTLDETLLLAETDPTVKVILFLDSSFGADVILGKPEIKSLKDLKGKKVGVESGALGGFVISRALNKVNLSPQDVQIVSLGVSEHEQAYKQGNIDAVVTFEPTKSKLLSVGAKILFDSSQIPGEILDVLVINDQALIKQKNQLKTLLNAWFKALDYIQKNPEYAAQKMAIREGVTPAKFTQSLKGLKLPNLEENKNILGKKDQNALEKVRQLGEFMTKQKLRQKNLDPSTLFDDTIVNNVQVN
jgi:NitT/TauT family transport system substrate-binding protein